MGETKTKTGGTPGFRSLAFTMRIISGALTAFMLILILGMVCPYIKDASSYALMQLSMELYAAVAHFIKGVLPTIVGGYDIVWLIALVAILFVRRIVHSCETAFSTRADKLAVQKQYTELREQMHSTAEAEALEAKMKSLKPGDAQSRAELLKLFAETKKKLDSMVRDLAFLSIDVVGSTAMKVGEDKPLVEHDFMAYKDFVNKSLDGHGQVKAAWTPDGVMICFNSPDDAVGAAKDVISGLAAFNKERKTIKEDFKVRCGVNAGRVAFDPAIPMEAMSDRVIDVTGHMQKYAAANSIFVSKQCLDMLKAAKDGFEPANTNVDGYEVHKWAANATTGTA